MKWRATIEKWDEHTMQWHPIAKQVDVRLREIDSNHSSPSGKRFQLFWPTGGRDSDGDLNGVRQYLHRGEIEYFHGWEAIIVDGFCDEGELHGGLMERNGVYHHRRWIVAPYTPKKGKKK